MDYTIHTEHDAGALNHTGVLTRNVLVLVLECRAYERTAFGMLAVREYDVMRAWHADLGTVRADAFDLKDLMEDISESLHDVPGIAILHDYVLPDTCYVEHYGMTWRSGAFGRMAKARERALRSSRTGATTLALRAVRGIAGVHSHGVTPAHDALVALGWTSGFEFVDGPTDALQQLAGSVIELNELHALRD